MKLFGQKVTPQEAKPSLPAFAPCYYLSGVNTPVCVQLLINKPEFTLGKSAECDGVLDFNPEISRTHCLIRWENGRYLLRDLGSTNHTYLNDILLDPDVDTLLYPGDRLRLSSSIFMLEQIHALPTER